MRYALQPTRYEPAGPRERAMYARTAHLYDLMYAGLDYGADAAALARVIRARMPGARSLLDVACGTGEHLLHLREHFEVEGVDIDPRMVALARMKLGDIPVHVGDMRALSLGRRFDAVVCLFSAIGAMATVEELDAAVASIASHAQPQGVVVVEPWVFPDAWEEGRLSGELHAPESRARLAVLGVGHRRGRVARIEMHVAVARDGGIEHHDERLELGLFSDAEYRGAFRRAGLDVEHIAGGLSRRGWYVGTRPATDDVAGRVRARFPEDGRAPYISGPD